ncbi:MAG: ribosome maturation factor RimM [Oscillospiraceae bacterium]
MKKQYIEVGKIVTVQGIKGELRVNPWCDSPEFLLDFKILFLDEGKTPINIERSRVQKNIVVLKIVGIEDIETANKYRNKVLYLKTDEVKLPKGSYFIQDLEGLQVIDADDNSIVYGELIEVSETGANDVYHIKQGEKLYLIPAIKQVVIDTDIDAGIMKIRPIKGLFGDED